MPKKITKRLFCFGLGYSVQHLAATLPSDEWHIAGTVRSAEARDRLSDNAWNVYLFDGTAPLENAAELLKGTTHLIASAPPSTNGDPVLQHHSSEIAGLKCLAWMGYLSTTGVYGNRYGDWVDETSSRTPSSPRGQKRVDAEDGWLKLWRDMKVPVHLFRLAGIYGPGRSALDAVQQGRARRVIKKDQVFSRIHLDDIATVLQASMYDPKPGRAYNLCDDEPAPPQDVITEACRLLDVDPPPEIPFEEADLSEMARGFYSDNKRVSNERIKNELGVALAWPNYREGLKGLIS